MYSITALPGLLPPNDPAFFARPLGINASNEIVGWAATSQTWRPVLWKGGAIFDLGTASAQTGIANAINDHGVVAGWIADTSVLNAPSFAFRWQNGTMTTLPMPNGYWASAAHSINVHGDIAGAVYRDDMESSAPCIWPAHGAPHVLSSPPLAQQIAGQAEVNAGALTINDSGEVLVVCYLLTGWLSFVWSGGSWTKVSINPHQVFEPAAMNDSELAVGDGFWWDQFTGLHQLGGPPPQYHEAASLTAISKSGKAAGVYIHHMPFKPQVAIVVELPSQAFSDLNTLIPFPTPWVLDEADAINDQGNIVGTGMNGSVRTPYLLTLQQKWPPWLGRLGRVPYTPPRKLPTHIWPGDPAPLEEFYEGTPVARAKRALNYASRLLDGQDRQVVEQIAARLKD